MNTIPEHQKNQIGLYHIEEFALLGGLVDASLQNILEGLRPRAVPRGTSICQAGDRASELYLVESGEVEIVAPAPGGVELILWRIGRGASFGEMPLLDIQPHAYTARARCDAALWVLPYRHLTTIYQANMEAFTLFMMNVARETARRSRQLSTQLSQVTTTQMSRRTRSRTPHPRPLRTGPAPRLRVRPHAY